MVAVVYGAAIFDMMLDTLGGALGVELRSQRLALMTSSAEMS